MSRVFFAFLQAFPPVEVDACLSALPPKLHVHIPSSICHLQRQLRFHFDADCHVTCLHVFPFQRIAHILQDRQAK